MTNLVVTNYSVKDLVDVSPEVGKNYIFCLLLA